MGVTKPRQAAPASNFLRGTWAGSQVFVLVGAELLFHDILRRETQRIDARMKALMEGPEPKLMQAPAGFVHGFMAGAIGTASLALIGGASGSLDSAQYLGVNVDGLLWKVPTVVIAGVAALTAISMRLPEKHAK